jgi:flagellar L-ring protein FlgH
MTSPAMTFLVRVAAIGAVLLLAACANSVKVRDTRATEPRAAVSSRAIGNGAIFQQSTFRPLFEDIRARYPGDTLVITLSEKTTATNSTADNATRSASVSAAVPKVFGLPGKMVQDTSLQASASTKLDNKDGVSSNNLFTGTITVTVSEVLDNGNLRVSGEKQIGINDDVDTLRFSGIVSPATIQPGNVVASAQVADARIETVSRSSVDPARVVGFLGRFFLSFIPFR